MKYNSISDDIYEYGYKITFSDYFTDVQKEKKNCTYSRQYVKYNLIVMLDTENKDE